jgi:hypothetical protein
LAEKYGVLEQYSVPDGGVLIALDGIWYHSSEKVRCGHCLRLTKNRKTAYYHSMTAAAIMRSGGDAVLPPTPEMIRNESQGEEGTEGNYEKQKQDCEQKAAARLLEKHGKYYKTLRATVLGDDLYANHAACEAVPVQGLSFIFTCKDESHPQISEQAERCIPETLETAVRTGRNHLEYRYKWINGLKNRADDEKLTVNYMYSGIYNREKDKITYKNS